MPPVQVGRDNEFDWIMAFVVDERRIDTRQNTSGVAITTVENFSFEQRDRHVQAVVADIVGKRLKLGLAEQWKEIGERVILKIDVLAT